MYHLEFACKMDSITESPPPPPSPPSLPTRLASKINIYFADVQGFKTDNHPNSFVLKELCFVEANKGVNSCSSSSSSIPNHYIFRAPFSYSKLTASAKKQSLYLTSFVHGFYWDTGFLDYSEILHTIQPLLLPNTIIYVKGNQKVAWLKQICNTSSLDCRNIEDLGYRTKLQFDHMRPHCKFHNKIGLCAYQNVFVLAEWFNNNNKNINNNNKKCPRLM